MHTANPAIRGFLAASFLSLAFLSEINPARADGFATPPWDQSNTSVAGYRFERFSSSGVYELEPKPSLVRIFVGPAGKLDMQSASPGLITAIDIGRGTAGGRLSASWLDVGADHGLSQYTAELTLDFASRSPIHPVLGAGGGVARTSSSVREDGSLDTATGATLGIGVLRAGLGFRLPFDDTDARIALDITGALPAIRTDNAPHITPWLLGALTVGIGF